MNNTNNDRNSLAHTKWNCKYHIVFAPKYRRKLFYCNPNGEQYQKLKKEKEEWLKSLCQTKIIRTLRKRRYLRAFLQILGRCTYSTTVLAFATNHRKYRRFCCRQV